MVKPPESIEGHGKASSECSKIEEPAETHQHDVCGMSNNRCKDLTATYGGFNSLQSVLCKTFLGDRVGFRMPSRLQGRHCEETHYEEELHLCVCVLRSKGSSS